VAASEHAEADQAFVETLADGIWDE